MSATPFPKVPAATQVRISKFIWRALMVFNFGVGAYIFAMPKKKSTPYQKTDTSEAPSMPTENTSVYEEPTVHSSITQPVRVQQSFLGGDQNDHFKRLFEQKGEIRKH